MTRSRIGKRRALGSATLVFAAALGSSCSVERAAPAQTTVPEIAAAPIADARLVAVRARAFEEFARQELVGLSLAIAEHGRIVAIEHFGFEDRERGIPVTDATLYRWASISKPLTAVVAMQLSNEGKLDLDRDVRTYVPEFPEKPWPITARQLLCHQGGVVHYSNGPVIAATPRADVEHPFLDAIDALSSFAPSPLVGEPGAHYDYTTRGFMLLGAVEQRAAGTPYPALVHDRIARPLGMTTLAPDYHWVAIDHRAAGYKKNGTGATVSSDDVDVSWKLPGGGFLSNVADLARFSIGLVEEKVVDHATRETMWTAQRTRDGAETGYGLGFEVASRGSEREIHHGGAQEKTRTHLSMLPERHLSIALMTNCEYAKLSGLAKAIADVWIADR